MIGVTMLDGGAERLRKRNRRIKMKAIEGPFASHAFFPDDGRAVYPIEERMAAKIPGPEEIVFGTRAVDGWAGFTIHEKHVVTFSPPAVLILKYEHSGSDQMSAACGVQPDVVFLPVKVRLTFNFGFAIAFPVRSPAVV